MAVDKKFGSEVGNLLEQHLRAEEEKRVAVSRVATGSAFEGWLSIETRLLLEANRERLNLAGTRKDKQHEVDHFWICNEHKKVDLGVIEWGEEEDDWVAAFEFKLVTNNKNWRRKVDEIWDDLYPRHGSKKANIRPKRGRFAFVAVMGKVFRDPGPYSWQNDLDAWEQDLWDYMLPTKGPWKGEVERVWKSQERFPLRDCWLAPNYNHFLELHMFARTSQ